ncbi:MAG: nucleoside triphosphate pyrophosphatase [Vicinamibacterales bacterium]
MSSAQLVLGSTSPRRASLLTAAGFHFRLDEPVVDETPRSGEDPEQYVVRLASEKARAVARRNPGNLVLAADTTVVIDGHILGKPANDAEATSMLQLLSGRAHRVLTGVALVRVLDEMVELESTEVRFLRLSTAEIDWYVRTGEPFGKAGGYAIQGLGSRFIDRIDGSYTNVVGLPVSRVCDMLKRLGQYELP